jgi:hypothetical protein
MILIGFEHIPHQKLEKVDSIEDISKTQANSVVLFEYDQELLNYCFENSLPSAVKITTVLQGLYCHNLGAKYIIVEDNLALAIQDIADHYLFDSKILVEVDDQNKIESYAKQHMDGVISTKFLG